MYSRLVRCLAFVCCALGAPAIAFAQPAELARKAAAERCAARGPDCDWLATFAPLERASVRRALAARGYVIEPSPWGKTIGAIHIYNEDVFAEPNWLRFFNFIHYTTREVAVRDELTIGPGHVWDDALVLESARRLRDPLYSSVVALLPVKSSEPGKVDLLVVTRDVWSLRLNSQYTVQSGSLTNLQISLSENNFLGNRDVFAAALIMDQGSIAVGPVFIDKNLLGSHLYLSLSAHEIVTRRSLDVITPDNVHLPTPDPRGIEDGGGLNREGADASASLSLPLWALASEWGYGVSYNYRNAISRNFFGTGLYGYDDPDTPTVEEEPWEYRLRTWSVNANAVRQWGTDLKQQLSIGYTVSSQRPSFLPGFTDDPVIRAAFERDVFPVSELDSAPYVEYSFFEPRYTTVRNTQTYELAEDLRLGANLDVSVSQGLKFLGSDYHFTRPSLAIGYTFPWCSDGFINPSASGSIRIQDGVSQGRDVSTIDDYAVAGVHFATPELFDWFRIVGNTYIETRWHDTQNAFYASGGDPELRGYLVNQQIGERKIAGQYELRTRSVTWWLLRIGAVAFYEYGGAANALSQLHMLNDIGIGLRVLVPQTSRDVFRFDLAFPLQAAPANGGAFSPHPILSFASAF